MKKKIVLCGPMQFRASAKMGTVRRRECIKWLIYDDILFYIFYASLLYVVCVNRMQSIKGSKSVILVCDT